jgi:hypothetical protein
VKERKWKLSISNADVYEGEYKDDQGVGMKNHQMLIKNLTEYSMTSSNRSKAEQLPFSHSLDDER